MDMPVEIETVIKRIKANAYIGLLKSLILEIKSENLSNALYIKNDNNITVGKYN
jgi:hypothetical protein